LYTAFSPLIQLLGLGCTVYSNNIIWLIFSTVFSGLILIFNFRVFQEINSLLITLTLHFSIFTIGLFFITNTAIISLPSILILIIIVARQIFKALTDSEPKPDSFALMQRDRIYGWFLLNIFIFLLMLSIAFPFDRLHKEYLIFPFGLIALQIPIIIFSHYINKRRQKRRNATRKIKSSN
jgi:hypothetical protein